jgi:hypothetical protein
VDDTEIRKKGILLEDAVEHFAPRHLRKAADAARQLPGSYFDREARDPETVTKQLVEQTTSCLERISAQLYVACEKQKSLFNRLRSGKLHAYAFATPRSPSDRRVRVPDDLLDEKYMKKDSTISGAGLRFVSVVVLHPRDIQQLTTVKAIDPVPSRPGGRQTSVPDIQTTMKSLRDDGRYPIGKTRKEQIPVIRAHVHERFPGKYPGDKGLGDDVIYREIRKFEQQTSRP